MSKLNHILFGRRFWAIVLAVVMVLQLLPAATFAETLSRDKAGRPSFGGSDNSGEGIGAGHASDLIDRDKEDPESPVGTEEPEDGTTPQDPAATEKPEDGTTPQEPVETEKPEDGTKPQDPADGESGSEPGLTIEYPVIFLDEDGNFLVRLSVLAGTAIGRLPSAPAVEGKAFAGWYTKNGYRVTSGTVVNGTIRVYARYDETLAEEMPAQNFVGVAANGVTVKASADAGVFPADTRMRVTAVDGKTARTLAKTVVSEGRVLTGALAVDITFVDAAGNKIEPKDAQDVRVSLSTADGLAGSTFRIYHVTENGSLEYMANASRNGGYFTSGSFSVYVVVAEGDDARMTVELYNGTTKYATMYVKYSDLDGSDFMDGVWYDPGAGTIPPGESFRGWTEAADGSGDVLDLNGLKAAVIARLQQRDIIDAEQSNATVMKFYTKSVKVYTLTYVDQKGVTIGVELQDAGSDGKAHVEVSESYVPFKSTQHFDGWTPFVSGSAYGTTEPYLPTYPSNPVVLEIGDDYAFNQNTILYPHLENGYWLTFDTNIDKNNEVNGYVDSTSADYTAPIFYETGTAVNSLPTPTRTGYTFGGWYKNKAMTQAFTAGNNVYLTENTTIYAKWTPAATTYRVVFMTQKDTDANDNDVSNNTYEYYDSIERNWYYDGSYQTVQAGTTVRACTNGTPNDSYLTTGDITVSTYYNKKIAKLGYYFTYSSKNSSESAVVKGDGSTILYVYYDRRPVSIQFHYNTIRQLTGSFDPDTMIPLGLSNGEYVRLTYEYSYWSGYTFYLNGNEYANYDYDWSGSRVYYYPNATYSSYQNTKTITGLYGSRIADGDWMDIPDGYRWHTYKNNTYSSYKDAWNYYENGSVYDGTTTTAHLYLRAWIANPAKIIHQITQDVNGNWGYDMGDTTITGSAITFRNIGGYNLYAYNYTEDNRANATLITSDSVTLDYDSIGSNGAWVYYSRNAFELEYMSNNQVVRSESSVYYAKPLSSYEYVSGSTTEKYIPTNGEAGYYFDGWYYDSDFLQPVDFSTAKMPAMKLSIYAKWTKMRFRVEIDVADATFDPSLGNVGLSFKINYGEQIQGTALNQAKREGYVLTGWEYSNDGGTTWYPFTFDMETNEALADMTYREADTPEIRGKIMLRATWRKETGDVQGITLQYNANGGSFTSGSTYVDPSFYVDGSQAVASNGPTPPAGQRFLHWTTADGTVVEAGKVFEIKAADADANFVITLTAVYEPIPRTSINWWYDVTMTNKVREDTNLVYNASVLIPTPTLPRTGYDFKGWNWTEHRSGDYFLTYTGTQDGATKSYAEGAKVAADQRTPIMELYGVWEPHHYTVVFDKNGGTGSQMADQDFTYDEAQNLTANTYTRTNYTFLGWSTDPNATTATYTDTQSVINLASEDGAVVTLYAVWKINAAEVVVHHYLKGTTTKVADDVTETAVIDTEYTAQPATAFLSGFSGFDLTADSYNPTQTITVAAEGNVITIYYTLPLKITASSQTITYDGTSTLTGSFSYEGALASDAAAIEAAFGTAPTIGPDAGSQTYTAGTDGIPGYYTIAENNPGTLTINKRHIIVTYQDVTKVYDGKTLFPEFTEYVITGDGLAEGHKVVAATAPGYKNVGVYDDWHVTIMTIGAPDIHHKVTDNYEIEYIPNTLTITPRPVHLVSASDTKVYDGQPLTNHTVTGWEFDEENETGFVEGEGATFNVTGTRTEIGTSDNTFTYTLNAGTYATNYTITKEYGNLIVTKAGGVVVTLHGNTNTAKYDGADHTVTGYTIDSIQINGEDTTLYTAADFRLKEGKEATATRKHVAQEEDLSGITYMGLTEEDFENLNGNFDSVTFVYTDGYQQITPRPITLTSGTATKVYDGTPLTEETVTVGGDGLVEGDGLKYYSFESRTDAGVTQNRFDFEGMPGTVLADYDFDVNYGTLTVTKAKVRVYVFGDIDDGPVYDGQEHVVSGYEVRYGLYDEASGLYNDYEGTPVGITVDLAEGKEAVAKGVDVLGPDTLDEFTNIYRMFLDESFFTFESNNYELDEIVIEDGWLQIFPRKVTLTSATDEKPYDGTALTNDTVTVGDEGFAPGEGATYDVTGSQTLVGQSENTFTYTLNDNTKASNYVITPKKGTLTVTDENVPDDLVVKKVADDATKAYNVGDTVTFTVTATNIYAEPKTITLTEIEGVTLSRSVFENVPAGESVTATATYVVTGEDVAAGSFTNTVTAKIGDLEKTASATVNMAAAEPALMVTKTASPTSNVKVGDTVTYTVVVTNSGNVTVTGITLDDTLVAITEAAFDLAPGATKEITYTYTVTQADVDAGKILNTVTATGKDPANKDVTATDDATVTTVAAAAALTVEKTANPASGVKVGDTVTYTVVVTNSGNVTVTGITLDDTLVAITEAAFDLAPNGTKTITYTYTVTQADVDAGKIDNTVTATGKDPANKDVTATDDATVTTVAAAAALTVEKTASPTSGVKVGDTVTYTVTVTNSGNVTVTGITLADTLVTLNEAAFDLAPGANKVITYTYTVTQADVDAGKIENTATATGKDPANKDVTAEDSATVTTEAAAAALTVEKTANPASNVKVGDTVTYTVTVTNSGNVTVTGITLVDTLVTLNEAAFDLAPGANKVITYTYTVTQADVDAGKIENTATATGKDPKNNEVNGTGSATVTTEAAAAALTVTKLAAPLNNVKVGDTVTYTVTVTNSGNVTVTGITLDDTLVAITEAAFDLAPGANKVITYTYTVTQADVDAGKIDNVVTATGKDPKNNDVTATDDATVTTEAAAPALTVEKTATPMTGAAAGATVTYTVKVTNEGNVTVKDITLDDTLVAITEPAFTLAPAETKTITYTYIVTQDDVDTGKIPNTVTATGKDPKGSDVTASDDCEVKTADPNAGLTVEKTANPASNVKVGDTVTYTIVVKNTGNVTVKGITLADTLVTITEAAFDLAPNGTKTITYTYTVTQADVDAGKIDNTVTATGKDPANKDVAASANATVTTEAAAPALTVEKTANPASGVKVGDTVTYTIVVKNTGNVTVKGITLDDTLVAITEAAFDLAPNGTKTITYTYTVTQADVDAGKIENTATATGKDPANKDVTAEDSATVTTEAAAAALTVEKTASPASGVKVGDTVTYTIVVKNTGNVTVTGITLDDTLVAITEAAFDLAPGATKEITYTYTVTQADVDAGKIENTATATGKDPANKDVTATDDATVTTVAAAAALTVEKTATPASNVKVGDTVTYTVTVTNSGNVTVTGITLVDTLVTLNEAAFDLAPGATKEITYTYTVTQADVDAGKIENTATATGKDPANKDVTATDDATVTTVAAAPALTVEKTASPASGVKVGDTVTYTVVVTNSGNVTVKGITLVDTLVTLNEAAFDLAPNGTKTITYTYTVTQADVDAGKILNTVTATGKDPANKDVTATDDATVTTVAAAPALTVEKTASPASNVKVGDTVTYTVVVTNSGNVTVTGITLDDTLVAITEAAFDLAPNGTKTITYTYTVTQADVDAGKIDNAVTATGKDPKNNEVTASDNATVTTEAAAAALTVEKTADPTSGVKVGDTVTYTVVVKNEGNVTVKDGKLEDDHADLSGKTFELEPGKSATFTYTYTVTQADVDAGTIVNTVKANATAVRGDNPAEVTASATVTAVDAASKLSITKSADPTSGVKVGDTITYTVVVKNEGNVTVKDGKLEDDHADLSGKTFTLEPGKSATFTYTYEVTQADVDAGTIVNTVKANATAARGDDPAEVTASATVTAVDAASKLSITKSATPTSGVKVGDTVTYTVVVKNEGNVTVTNGTLEDDHANLSAETFELAPGATKTFTYNYTVTQDDVDAGTIVNTVKANAKAARGDDPAEVTASATVTAVDAASKLSITKTANPAADAPVDSDIIYTIVVKNEGNVTLKNVKVVDDLTGDTFTVDTLAPGASETFTATYTVTQADVDAGELNNTATASAKAVRGEDPADVEASAKVTFTQTPEITVDKVTTSNPSDPYDQYVLDDEITYKITVTNSGNVTLKNVIVVDELTGDEWTIDVLAPNESKTFATAPYTVTVDDVVAGSVKNVATASATAPKGETVEDDAEVEDATMKRNDNDLDIDADSGSITVVYDGKSHTVTANATVADSVVWYSTDSGATWTETAPSRIAVGVTEFSIKATHPAYEDVIKEGFTITVTPKDLTVTVEDKSKIYGDEDPELTITVEGLVEGESLPANFFRIFRDEGEDVGEYVIHAEVSGSTQMLRLPLRAIAAASGFDASNYDITVNEGTFTIRPRTVTVTADDKTKLKGKEDPELTATVEGLVNGDTISYTLSREPGEATGKYTITPAGEATQGNYVVVYKTGTLTIVKKTQKMGTFSLIWISDAVLKGEGAYDDAFRAIVEKANTIRALATFGTGNLVESFDNEAAWTNAKKAIGKLRTAFYMVAGAKDVNGDAEDYGAYLAADRNDLTHRNEDGSVWFKAFRQQPILVVGIGSHKIAVTDEEKEREAKWIAFANDAISQNPNKYVIILVNDYIDANGELTEFGKLVEEKLVANNENVRLVLCGGADGAAQLEKTYGERKVNAIMFNYTADEENGLGFLRVLSFDGDAKTITISTVNALNDKTAYDENKPEVDNFIIDEAF